MEEIKNIDLKSVVEQESGIKMKKVGKLYQCQCPLHNETSASFKVYPETNSFYCFGCGKGGDVIEFLKQYRNYDFKEACNHLGIEMKPIKHIGDITKDVAPTQKFINWVEKKETKDADGNVVKTKILPTTPNMNSLLEAYSIEMAINTLSKEIEVNNPNDDFGTHDDKDVLYDYITDLSTRHGVRFNKEKINTSLNTLAKRNRFNPVKDYLEECLHKHNKTVCMSMVNALMDTLVIDTKKMDADFAKILIKKWLLSCVAIPVINDPSYISNSRYKEFATQEGILTFQSFKQGIGKTSWFRYLIHPNWFGEGKELDTGNKDTYIPLLKNWIAELGEVDSTLKKQQSQLKAFITKGEDEYRVPYGQGYEKYPRTTIFCATVNPAEFLRDDTGNRRWWVVPVLDINKIAYNNIDMDLMWGELYAEFLNLKDTVTDRQAPWHLTSDEREQLEKYNSDNHSSFDNHSIHEYILEIYDFDQPREWVKAVDVKKDLQLILRLHYGSMVNLIDSKNNTMFGNAVKRLQIESKTSSGKRYLMPPIKAEYYKYFEIEDLK